MNKKRLWVIMGVIISILVLIISVGIYNNFMTQRSISQDKAAAISIAENFSVAWFNYTKQSDSNYLTRIKPFMTPAFYDATSYVNSERPQDFEGQKAMTAKIISSSIENYSSENTAVKVEMEISEETATTNIIEVLITLIKIDNDWKVSSFE